MELTKEQVTAVRAYTKKQSTKPVTIAFLGSGGVGKESIIFRLVRPADSFDPNREYDPTFEPSDYQAQLILHGKPVRLECERCHDPWSHPDRQEDHLAVLSWLAKRSDACIYVYSVTDRASFDRLSKLHSSSGISNVLFVMENKTEQPREVWEVSTEEGKQFSSSIGAEFLTVSAKTGRGCSKRDAAALVCRVLLFRIRSEESEAKLEAEITKAAAEEVSRKERRHSLRRAFQHLKDIGKGVRSKEN